jgi:hypothetical protein
MVGWGEEVAEEGEEGFESREVMIDRNGIQGMIIDGIHPIA